VQSQKSTWVLVLGLIAVQSVQHLQVTAFVVVAPTGIHRDIHQRNHASISISISSQSPTRYHNKLNKNARITSSRRYLAARAPDVDSTDPFAVLGLEPTAALDKKEIKRAYKRLALKFHPDVVTNKDSPKTEKKAASDRFAKINWAYETLSGKREMDKTYSSSSTKTKTGSAGTSGYTPPHRRKEAYSAGSTSGRSTDWRDYMPKYGDEVADDDKKYDAGGDSFGSIFSDLFNGASSAAAYTKGAAGSGIFRDFIEFLESNVDGYAGGSSGNSKDDDAQLKILLQTGTVAEIGEEMDDTDLVVQQLSSKLGSVNDDLVMLNADLKVAIRYLEKLDLEERVAELQARKSVVEGYLKKARKRLLALQTRYKQLIVNGDNDFKAGGGRSSSSTGSTAGSTTGSTARPSPGPTGASSSSRNDSTGYSAKGYSTSSSSTGSTSSSTGTSDSSRSSASSTKPGSASEKEDAWKSDSFGSFGRGRSSSSRQRASRTRSSRTTEPAKTTTTASSSSSSSSSGSSTTGASGSNYQDTSTSTRQTQSQTDSDVPPHRRTSSTPRDQDDTRRMRDLKVDDEFEKLKKELGL
jgi:curved DNA-binding protein CbpA